jgi:transposase
MNDKYTIQKHNDRFPDDAACLQYIFDQRFPNGGTCEKCGKKNCFHPVRGRKSYACAWCGFQVSPTAGTIFHKSSTSLRTWFHAMFLMTASRNGVSAMELMRQTGVTYKTAWRMNHQIRRLMKQKDCQFTGIVEADEAYIGGIKRGVRGRGAKGKTPVIGVLERGGDIAVRTVQDISSSSLTGNICKTTSRGATVMTDELRSYNPLSDLGFNHQRVTHSAGEFVKGEAHTNGIESFWAQLKRSINGTFHHVSSQHLQKYLNEFAYRHNHRHSVEPMFCQLVSTAGEQHDLAE